MFTYSEADNKIMTLLVSSLNVYCLAKHYLVYYIVYKHSKRKTFKTGST